MNHWPFILAAYGLVLGATGLIGAISFVAMRRAEAAADALKGRR